MTAASCTAAEIASQATVWPAAAALGRATAAELIGSGRGVVFGCGTSAFVAQIVAAQRESAGAGETDAAFASEILARPYDHAVAVSRSATTTEVLDALPTLRGARRVGITAVPGPVNQRFAELVDDLVVVDMADERSVVQTRFPTAVVVMFRAALGERADVGAVAAEALAAELPDLDGLDHFVFLANGADLGYANEAALKVREMAQAWSESHLAMDYRHGPIAVAGRRSLIQVLGDPPAGLVGQLSATGATVLAEQRDPLGSLVVAQRIALALCERRGLDPDHPNRLTRSVVLSGDER